MATQESEDRMVRRHLQRYREAFEPAVQAWRRDQRRRTQRHPYRHVHPALLWLFCRWWGSALGGRPPQERRCTKRLGTRYCWNWRVEGTTRCHRHQSQEREATGPTALCHR
jgi:hypothetical protein